MLKVIGSTARTVSLKTDVVLNVAGNPNVPTQGEIIAEIFTAEEAARWEACVRPIIESGAMPQRSSVAHVTARKDGGREAGENQE